MLGRRKLHPRRGGRGWVAVATVVALALLAMLLERTPPLWGSTTADPTTVRAEFGFCHEGGGTNCVVDGDTFWAAGKKVRISGIEAPETHEPRCAEEAARGKAATQMLQALLNSGTVTLTPAARDRDQHGRLLRNVSVDGKDVGKALIAAGLARQYAGSKKPWC